MEKWVEIVKGADFLGIGERFGISPVIARVIRNRDIVGDDAIRAYLCGSKEDLKDPFLLKDMDRAAAIMQAAVREGKRIRIIGDYDIDGIMSSYILFRGITKLGGIADIRIPNRMTDGYGMNELMIEEAKRDGIDVILTCDNGISAIRPVELAKEYGMTVVVTDHHEVISLPKADAVVDPKRPDDLSGSGGLCGGAVAWKLILAMGGDPEMEMLQFAAFATVGDIMDLTGENRILVKEGLKQLRQTDNTGLRALADVCGIRLKDLSTYHIGFILGPCLNASGRLDSAMRAEQLLLTESYEEAVKVAEELKSLNDSRKALTESGVQEAVRVIERDGLASDRVLVVFLPEVHESIAGIIAGRIRETYSRPTFILTRGEAGAKGSGRSTEEYPMFDELVKVQDLLIKFGGHPMAAGLTLREEQIDLFREALLKNCTLTESDLVPKRRIDMALPVSALTGDLVDQLSLLEPFGKGNEKPLFADRRVLIEGPRLIGAKKNLLKMRVRHLRSTGQDGTKELVPEGPFIDAIAFRNAEELASRAAENPAVCIAYEPVWNEYMGVRSLQIIINHFQ